MDLLQKMHVQQPHQQENKKMAKLAIFRPDIVSSSQGLLPKPLANATALSRCHHDEVEEDLHI